MQFAQKLHSIEEMEKDRVKFYQRFQELDKDQPHLTYKPTYESEGKMLKTLYVSTKDKIRALRIRKRLLARGFVVMWTGNGLMCLMKQ